MWPGKKKKETILLLKLTVSGKYNYDDGEKSILTDDFESRQMSFEFGFQESKRGDVWKRGGPASSVGLCMRFCSSTKTQQWISCPLLLLSFVVFIQNSAHHCVCRWCWWLASSEAIDTFRTVSCEGAHQAPGCDRFNADARFDLQSSIWGCVSFQESPREKAFHLLTVRNVTHFSSSGTHVLAALLGNIPGLLVCSAACHCCFHSPSWFLTWFYTFHGCLESSPWDQSVSL